MANPVEVGDRLDIAMDSVEQDIEDQMWRSREKAESEPAEKRA